MNAKIIKTKQALLDAFFRLIESTAAEDITVSQLCLEAGINRTTFYRYYAVPMDVVVEAVEKLTEEVLYSEDLPHKTVYEYMLSFCHSCYENRKLMGMYMSNSGNMVQLFYKVALQQAGNLSFMEDPVNNFIAGGVSSTIMSWIIRGCVESPEQVARHLSDCISRLDPDKV